jgi:hypothetical protein
MNNSLRRRVMARIYLEYTKNIFTEYPDYIMFFLFMAVSFTFVSVRNVLENIPKDNLINAFNFFVVAVKNTTWIIQALIAGFVARVSVAGAMLVYKSVKNIDTSWWISKFGFNSDTENSSL